ncbi:MAG TPA: extracellular solute-binding protein [Bacilli bacterium]
MKKTTVFLVVLTLVWALAACGGNNADKQDNANPAGETATPDQAAEQVTLRIAWWGSQPRHDYTLKVLQMYETQHPNVKFEPEYASWDDYWKKLAPEAAANELPDIIQMDLSYIAQYGEKNQLADLTPFIGNAIDTSKISDSVVSGGKIGDKLYGFNLGVNAVGFHYDPALLKKATGQDTIDSNWTWDDYVAMAEKAKDAGLYMDTGMKADVFFRYYLRTKGKSLFNADGTALGYDDDQLFVDHFGRLAKLVNDKAVPTPDIIAQIKGIEDDLAVKQQAIGIWQWSNQFVGFQQVANRPLKMVGMPGPDASKGLYLKPSMYFSISQNSENKEEAAKFINFFVNDVEANKLINGDRGVPGSTVVKEALKPALTPQQAQVFDYIAWAEQNSSQMDAPDPIGTGEVIAALEDLTQQLNFGKITAEEAAKQFRTKANAILAKNK